MFGDILHVLWMIVKYMAVICIGCVILRFILKRMLKVIVRLMKWFVLPLVKDINKIRKAYKKSKEQMVRQKPAKVNNNNLIVTDYELD